MENKKTPEELLASIQENTEHSQKKAKGKLKIFFGYCAGVGKTYAMLDAAHEQLDNAVDIVIGYIEPHPRPETSERMLGLEIIPTKTLPYKTLELTEPDVDAIITRMPEIVLIDELAHTNAPGSRHKKRYRDIEEILDAGISVYTTINVQHLESLNDKVEEITGVHVQETIPDAVFDAADEIELVDFPPKELLIRLQAGKIYQQDKIKHAQMNFFTEENLRLLRELALRRISNRVIDDNKNTYKLVPKRTSSTVLVCIGHASANKIYLRRAAAIAKSLNAALIAIHVEQKDKEYSEKEKQTMRENLEYAEYEGAELVVMEGYELPEIIAEYATARGVTDIVVGSSAYVNRFIRFMHIPLADSLLKRLPNVEFHIISSSHAKPMSNNNWMGRIGRRILQENKLNDFFVNILLYIITVIATILLQHFQLGEQNILMVFLLYIILTARISASYIEIFFAIVLSILTYDFLFVTPVFNFQAFSREYPVTFIVMFLISIIVSQMTFRMKKQTKLVTEREQKTKLLFDLSNQLLATREKVKIIALVNEYLSNMFKKSVVFFPFEDGTLQEGTAKITDADKEKGITLLDEQTRTVASWVCINQKKAGNGTDTLSNIPVYIVPLIANGESLGAIGVSVSHSKLSAKSRNFLQVCCTQISLALERQHISAQKKETAVMAEKEAIRSNLLRSISHDLRSPLTGIIGSVDMLMLEKGSIDQADTQGLLKNIKEESQWLLQMVENLLAMTRIAKGTATVAKQDEVVEEIIADVIRKVRARYKDIQIQVSIDDQVFVVPMDPILIIQVLLNIIENTIKYAGNDAAIKINVSEDKGYAIFTITDNGKGIPEEIAERINLNKSLDATKSDSTRGLGIGLSLCKTIIELHGGTLQIHNAPTGGVQVLFTLPETATDVASLEE